MIHKNIKFILIQIDEAHSTAWPAELVNTPTPQVDLNDRVSRANIFASENDLNDDTNTAFSIFVDDWDNTFGELFRAWPDVFYLVDHDKKVIAKSEYGKFKDARINYDCTTYLETLCS